MQLADWYEGELPQGSNTPLSLLVLQPTPFCNIACDYCYLSDTTDRRRMAPETISAVCRNLRDSGFVEGKLTILWHAGEPLVVGPRYYQAAFDRVQHELPQAVTASHSFQ